MNITIFSLLIQVFTFSFLSMKLITPKIKASAQSFVRNQRTPLYSGGKATDSILCLSQNSKILVISDCEIALEFFFIMTATTMNNVLNLPSHPSGS